MRRPATRRCRPEDLVADARASAGGVALVVHCRISITLGGISFLLDDEAPDPISGTGRSTYDPASLAMAGGVPDTKPALGPRFAFTRSQSAG